MKKLGRIIILITVFVMLQACASTKMAEELQGGKISFEDGNFKSAFHKLLPLASEGNAQAEYAVGYMYYYGYGTTQDTESGLFWMNKAAEQHYEPAIKALAMIRENKVSPEPTQQFTAERSVKEESDAVLKELAQNKSAETTLPPLAGGVDEDPDERLARSLPAATPEEAYPNVKESQTQIADVTEDKTSTDAEGKAPVVSAVPPKQLASDNAAPADFNAVREKKYTLQLMGSYALADVKNIQSHLKIASSTYCGVTKHNGRDWYVLAYGKYPAPYLAKLAMDDLPQNVREMKPWVRQANDIKMVT